MKSTVKNGVDYSPQNESKGIAFLSHVDDDEVKSRGVNRHIDDDVNVSAVRQQLCRILDSRTFRQSKRLCAFLEFSVTETLAGRSKSITAPTVAIEVFSKGQELDLKSEGLVRVQARQIRLKLSSYYEDEGKDDPIRISMPQGGYSAAFERRSGDGEVLQHHAKNDDDELSPPEGVPIYVTAADATSSDPLAADIAAAIPHDIAAAMALFPDFEICDVSYSRDASKKIQPPSMTLNGNLTWDNGHGHYTASLQDTRTHEIFWSRQYKVDDWEGRLDVARRIAVAIASPSGAVAARRAHAMKTGADSADEATALVFQVSRYASRPNAAEHARLKNLVDEFVARGDVINPRIWAAVSLLKLDSARFRYSSEASREELMEASLSAARRAVTLGPDCSYCWCMLSGVYHEIRDFVRFEAAAQTALQLNPNNADAMAIVGTQLWENGRIDEGLKLIDEAFAINDQPPSWYFFLRVHEAIRKADFAEGLRAVAHIEMSDFFWPSLLEASIYGHLQDAQRFNRAFENVKSLAPWMLENLNEIFDQTPFPEAFKVNLLKGLELGQQANQPTQEF